MRISINHRSKLLVAKVENEDGKRFCVHEALNIGGPDTEFHLPSHKNEHHVAEYGVIIHREFLLLILVLIDFLNEAVEELGILEDQGPLPFGELL